MNVIIVEQTDTHIIKHVEFLDLKGKRITSFYQAVKKPNISLGISDTLNQAQYMIRISEKFKIIPQALDKIA